jgi:DNA-binding MarR family transcriptional regulator
LPCTALRKASRRISQLYDTALAPSGVKTTQRAILAQIGRSEPVTVALAEALVMDSGALAHTLKPLERDGLLAVAVDPADRRNRLTSLRVPVVAVRSSKGPLTEPTEAVRPW